MLKLIAARGDECLLGGGRTAACQTRASGFLRVTWFNLSIRCVVSGEVTKAGGEHGSRITVILLFLRAFKSLCAGKEGVFSNTCVSDLESSLLNDLHLFSDL